MKKKILFVINTMGRAGAEVALLELLKAMDKEKYEISLFVLLGQGELIDRVPEGVRVLNENYQAVSVLSSEGKAGMIKTTLRSLFRRGTVFRRLPYLLSNAFAMIRNKKLLVEKLLWRVISDGADRFEEEYDLAVAYLEGGSTYYVADHVKAKKKAAFLHVDYERAGYDRRLDLDAYSRFDRVFTVSKEVEDSFRKAYPEHGEKCSVFHNMLDLDGIRSKASQGHGFTDDFQGIRLLTVGRLTWQKAYDVAIDAMALIRKECDNVRWYVLGEGPERETLEKKIEKLGLQDDFLLLGATDNPFPYYLGADVYVHATRFEGKSIAIQEAQALGRAIVASDCSGNREQIENGVDGLLCDFNAEAIKEAVVRLVKNQEERESLAKAAAQRKLVYEEDLELLYELT